MKALVTGANGLIGSNLVKALLRQGHYVRAFVRQTSNLSNLDGVSVDKAYGDILEGDTLINAALGCDFLFHVAGIFSYSTKSDELMTVAKAGTLNALKAAKQAGVKKIVLTSSSVVFGSTSNRTILDVDKKVTDPDPSPYVISKILQEKIGFERAAELGLNMVAVCPTICIGPHDYGLSESNAIIINYLKDPFRVTWLGGCNLVSVHDVVQGHILAANRGKAGMRYLLGSQNLEWYEIHKTISELCGIDGPFVTANHTSSYLAATAHEIIGFLTNKRPFVTRAQAKMVGRYYWYNHDRSSDIGYVPKRNARQALANAISWLVKSHHISNSLRNTIKLSQEIYDQR